MSVFSALISPFLFPQVSTLLPPCLLLSQNIVSKQVFAEDHQLKGEAGLPNPSVVWFPKPYHLTQCLLGEGHYFLLHKKYYRQGKALPVDASFYCSLNSEKWILWEKQYIGCSAGCQSLDPTVSRAPALGLGSKVTLMWYSVLSAMYAPEKLRDLSENDLSLPQYFQKFPLDDMILKWSQNQCWLSLPNYGLHHLLNRAFGDMIPLHM